MDLDPGLRSGSGSKHQIYVSVSNIVVIALQVRLEKFEPFLEELRSKSKSRTVTLGTIKLAQGGDESAFADLLQSYGEKSRTGTICTN